MREDLLRAVARLKEDRTSGASELVAEALGVLRLAQREGPAALAEAAGAMREAQPAMASLRNLAAAALRVADDAAALDRFESRWRRAGPALVRTAVSVLLPEGGRSARFVTCSFSGSVLACLQTMATRTPVSAACGEGRPAFEGRRMATALAAAGVEVTLLTDAALGEALEGADALLLGADAVGPGWFLNKCGSGALAAAALQRGTPAYVLATRDKFLDADAAGQLRVEERAPGEVWETPPPGVTVRNPYFERVPIDWLAGVITDAGLLGAGMVEQACQGRLL